MRTAIAAARRPDSARRRIDGVTETSARVAGPAPLLGSRGWAQFALWLCAWNAVVPIRLVSMIFDPLRPPGYIGPLIERLILDHTSWAIVTYVMFRVALRARHEPLRQVLVFLGLLAVPLMLVRYFATFAIW